MLFTLHELSKSLSGLSTYGVLVECVNSDEKKDQATMVSNLQQLWSKEKKFMKNEMKLLLAELDCKDCEENLTTCENTYNKQLQVQIALKKLQTLVKGY